MFRGPQIEKNGFADRNCKQKQQKIQYFGWNIKYFLNFESNAAAKTLLAGLMRPAGRVFETPVLEDLLNFILIQFLNPSQKKISTFSLKPFYSIGHRLKFL